MVIEDIFQPFITACVFVFSMPWTAGMSHCACPVSKQSLSRAHVGREIVCKNG